MLQLTNYIGFMSGQPIFPSTTVYNTPGIYQFLVPKYHTIDVTCVGGGGSDYTVVGTGKGGVIHNGVAGDPSYFSATTNPITAAGGAGGTAGSPLGAGGSTVNHTYTTELTPGTMVAFGVGAGYPDGSVTIVIA